jgi:hypothetical protein
MQRTGQAKSDARRGVPRWVTLLGIVLIIVGLLIVVMMMSGGVLGGHVPPRH